MYASEGQATALKRPTLGGVQSSQEQHLKALRRLDTRSRKIAEHLYGAEPSKPESGKPPISAGSVEAMHENMMDAAALGESIAYNLVRIETAMGLPHLDEAMPETTVGHTDDPRLYRSASIRA